MRAPHLLRTVCLRFRNYLFCSRRSRYARHTLTLRARGGCAAMFHSCNLALRARSPSSRLRGTTAPPRLRARGPRYAHADSITCADCPNECLYQFESRSVQPFGRQRLISENHRGRRHWYWLLENVLHVQLILYSYFRRQCTLMIYTSMLAILTFNTH
jgi:hypothetical protein